LVEVKWLKAACDGALSIDGGPMWFKAFAFRMWHKLRPGRATKEKWRIPDGKVRERSVIMFGATKVVTLT
jgi:hypothetical protein